MRYLFQRKEGGNFYIKLQPPGGKLIERSLGTPDLKAAEIAAADLIKQHKALLYQRRQARVTTFVHKDWIHDYEPGLHTLPEGGHVMAADTVLTFTDAAGKITGTKPNGGPVIHLSGAPLPAAIEFQVFDDAMAGLIGEGRVETDRPKFVAAKSHPDDAILETYLKHNGITGTRERQAREVWRIFRTVVDKPLRECTREDGRAIVSYMEDEAEDKGHEAKSATLRRRMVPLVAAVNLAIDEGKHKGINPFAACVPKRDDEDERSPFDDDDMKMIRANLRKLEPNDQLLLRVLATTGMRRGEAFEISSEKAEDGIRYCEVGTKTPQSRRRVPFPKALLPHLPKKITGPLFTGHKDSTGKRLGAFLRDIGINDPDKAPMHSFRHRAANRLRRAGIPEDLREAIGGWADGKKKISRKYGNKHGRGFPIKMLKEAIDKIGF
ncbi:MAG TPA: tyrosine-type recombinase/integrase [Micropepsaceae bacterium]|nr:tyrosine-type recombinase/integrase [Micropepsaceae bacterium]